MNIEQARFNMIEQQIRPWDVLDGGVLEVFGLIQRELFVPPAHKALAFADLEVPLPGGQSMLAPKVEARMLQDAALVGGEKVLEVGTGSGYMAALLAHRAAQVISLEIVPELVTLAASNLSQAGIHNVQVRQADGSNGAVLDGPFDVIVLSGSVMEVSTALLDQLKIGGRLVAIVGDDPVMRGTVVTRTTAHTYTTSQRWDYLAPRLQHFPEPSRFTL